MTSDDAYNESVKRLERLSPPAPDPTRAERVRRRCRAQLIRGRQRTARTAVMTGFTRRVLAPVVVGGFCVLYVTALVTATLRFYGVFR